MWSRIRENGLSDNLASVQRVTYHKSSIADHAQRFYARGRSITQSRITVANTCLKPVQVYSFS